MGPFNNRETATALWLLVFLAWALQKANIRKGITGVVRLFCRFKILVPVCLMVLYTATIVMLLAAIDLWNVFLLKDTIVWFCVGAMAMMVRFVTSEHTENFFQKVLIDSIKIVILLEFLVNTYTFSLGAELVIVPIMAFIAMVDAIAKTDKEYAIVAKLTGALQVIIGLAIIGFVTSRVVSELQSLQNLDTLRRIILVPVLSILLSPFIYIMVLITKYEIVFQRIDFGVEKDPQLKHYARRRILMHAGISLRRLDHILGNHAVDLMGIQTEADVDRLLQPSTDCNSGGSHG